MEPLAHNVENLTTAVEKVSVLLEDSAAQGRLSRQQVSALYAHKGGRDLWCTRLCVPLLPCVFACVCA